MNTEQTMALTTNNAALLEEMYDVYKTNSSNVTPDWAAFFQEIETQNFSSNGKNGSHPDIASSLVDRNASSLTEMGLMNLLNAYRRQGHLAANVDPLGILKPNRDFINQKLKNLQPGDLETTVNSPGLGRAKLKDVINWYEKTYCGTIGSEQYYIVNDEEREWIQNKMESTANSDKLDKGTCLRLFEKLFQADYFEQFLAKKYVGKKRFSLEGGETMIPMLDTIIEEAGAHGMDGLVIGMAHRGRLNVLVNTIEKPARLIFAEFEEKINNQDLDHYADVKYHLGYSNVKMTKSGKEVKLSLGFNPSHLEAVNPVVTGSARARKGLINDTNREKYMPILIHGDAAFAGQGVVAETLNLMNLEGYTTGGTFHIVINNQIGFTTLPEESRSTLYATDLAKGFQIPIFHINGDDPEAAHRVVKLCLEYRQKFHKDVIIDLICYRRLGHNENDEPAFTQPIMYEIIKKHPPTVEIYEKVLLSRKNEFSTEDLDFIKNGSKSGLEESFNRAKEEDVKMQVETMQGVWSKLSKEPLDSEPATKLLAGQIQGVVKALTEVPIGFSPNSKLVRLLENRKKMASGEMPIDWGFAEALSFGSILQNGFRIRLSGQDAQRGTFSHRHAVLVESNTGKKHVSLNHISPDQGKFEVVNSSLSEYSVLGFEYGFSLSDPSTLVIWEAQFGDFANTAQVIFDQFISSSEVKWQRLSGLVVLLPHGYEGQGPEHSSARLERYLQLCALDNMQVCNCTTPAQYFHLLRRQILRNFRKPLIVMSPKSLLRFPAAASAIEDLTQGAFKEVIIDKSVDPKDVSRIIFCTGKVYYDLLEGREKKNLKNVAIVRVEQLYPYPSSGIKETLKFYPAAKDLIWAQEEPKNQGAWKFIEDHLNKDFGKNQLQFAGRKESPSPSAGQLKVHMREQQELVEQALTGK
ncbi:MAG: 2-oxoglutarate dehydrogenase E1 component [Leptospira sp.]|nr:2-oxoglutarate dehydrogenase E1 component [Leptospira sp.]